jgi:hypothetical protein
MNDAGAWLGDATRSQVIGLTMLSAVVGQGASLERVTHDSKSSVHWSTPLRSEGCLLERVTVC